MSKVHPNSLKNLRPFSKEGARAGHVPRARRVLAAEVI